MKRIHLYYEGLRYTVAGRELADLKSEIERALTGDGPRWLTVNHGEGSLREIELLLAPGIGIGVMAVDADSEDPLPPALVALPGDLA